MEITGLLQRVHGGDQEALNTVIPLVYSELKKLAAAHLRREGKARPLENTALVHEAFPGNMPTPRACKEASRRTGIASL
jgi:type IV secretory pathway VirD2 relaxase